MWWVGGGRKGQEGSVWGWEEEVGRGRDRKGVCGEMYTVNYISNISKQLTVFIVVRD